MSVDEIRGQLLEGPNPFEPTILPFDRTLDVPDVAEIHAQPTSTLIQAVERTRKDGKARGILIRGESGTGKTHLLRRVSQRLGGRAMLAAIDPIGDPTRLIRHILRRLVVELSAPSGPCGSVLREMAGALIGEGIYAIPEGAAKERLLSRIIEARRGFMRSVDAFTLDCIEAFARALARNDPLLDLNVIRVLLKMWLVEQTAMARDWLKGIDLDDDEQEELGVTRTLAGEDDAESALRTLLAGARLFRPIVLCFDQTETLASLGGEAVVRELFRAISRLESLPGVVIIFTCLEDVWTQSYQAIAREIEVPPLRTGALRLNRLGPHEAKAIIAARLKRTHLHGDAPYPSYPVPDRTLQAMQDLSPREMLEFCSRALEAMRAQGRISEIEPPEGAALGLLDDPGAALDHEWKDALGVAEHIDSPDEQTIIDGLFQLLRVAKEMRTPGWPAVVALEREQGDAALTVQIDQDGAWRRTWVLASDTQNGTSLAKLLDRMLRRLGSETGTWSTLMRLAPERPTWKKAAERLEELRARGAQIVRPGPGVTNSLGAVRILLGRVAAGDVTAGGRDVTDDEALRFLAAKVPLGKLLAVILGHRGA